MTYIERYSTLKNIIIGLIFIAFINIVAFPYFPTLFNVDTYSVDYILDLKFGFSLDTIVILFEKMKEDGRNVYLISTIVIDVPYTIIYGFIYSYTIYYLLKKANLINQKWISILPFLISIFDIIENIGIIYFIKVYPNINENYISLFSFSNKLKWVFAFIVFIVIVGLTIKILSDILTRRYIKKS